MADYEWRDNLACKATYAVFTHPGFAQLKPEAVSFENAGARKMGTLPFFNHTASSSLRYKLARLRAQEFLLYLKDIHPLVRQNSDVTLGKLYNKLADVLSTADATISKLAGVIDENIKFPDEVQVS